jgi:hypothetical protein
VAGGDPLLQRPHLAGDRLHEPLLTLGQGRDDGIGQLEGRAGVQPSRLDPPQHGAGLAQGGLGGDRRVHRAVHGDQIAGAEELVQLHVVDVAAGAELGGVQDDQEVVAGGPDLGTALRSTPAWTARGGSRRPPSAPGRPPRRRRGCPPDQPVVAGQQLLQLPRPDAAGCRHRTPSERPSRRPPPGSSAPGAGLAPMPTVPAQQPDRAPKGCGGTGRERPASRGNDQAKQTGQAADLALWSPRRDSNPRPSDYEATATRKDRVGWVRQRSLDKVLGKLEQACARQNIGHVIGHGSQPAVTIRTADPGKASRSTG